MIFPENRYPLFGIMLLLNPWEQTAPSAVDLRRGLCASGGLRHRDPTMGARMLTTVLIVLLILLLLGVIPHRRWGWGYGPSHVIGIVLIVLLILVLAGRV